MDNPTWIHRYHESGSKLLSVVWPNCFSSPFKLPWKFKGRATPKLIRVMMVVKTIRCRWKDKYWTASSPHFARIWSSLKIENRIKYAQFKSCILHWFNFLLLDTKNCDNPRKHSVIIVWARIIRGGSMHFWVTLQVFSPVKYLCPSVIKRAKSNLTFGRRIQNDKRNAVGIPSIQEKVHLNLIKLNGACR